MIVVRIVVRKEKMIINTLLCLYFCIVIYTLIKISMDEEFWCDLKKNPPLTIVLLLLFLAMSPVVFIGIIIIERKNKKHKADFYDFVEKNKDT